MQTAELIVCSHGLGPVSSTNRWDDSCRRSVREEAVHSPKRRWISPALLLTKRSIL